MRRLESLTGARFFAAIAVLLFHFMALITGPKALELPASFGRIGVCFFFVLSGFVLAYNYRDRFIAGGISKNYRQFFWARFVRVIPSHVLLLLLITPLCLWLNARGALMAASSSPVVPAPTAAASWFANLFLVQVYFPRREFEMMWNAPAWSIACEVVFYLLFPLLMLALSRIANSPSKLIAAGLGFWMLETVAVMASLYVFRRMHQSILPETKFDFYFSRMPFIRVGEFATGCCAGLLFLRLQDQSKSLSGNRLSILSLIVGGICLACFGSLAFFRYTSWFLAFVPAFTVIIIALASNATIWSSLLQHPVVLVLGEAS
jgi:peptidoglycan/LPS O-acetylase OafA/YrhL